MKFSKTYIILLLTATTVGGAALAWRQYGELVELRAAAMNRNERADLQKRIWDLEKANRDLQDQLAAQQGSTDVDDLLAIAPDAERTSPSRDRGSRGERGGDSRGRGGSGMQQAVAMRDLMSKPEVQAMVGLQLKSAIESRYAPLFKNLNLPVEQIDRLKTLLAERVTTMQDVASAAREQGISPRDNPEAYRQLFTDAQNQINASIKSAIGDQGFAQLTNYEQTMPQRNVVNELQQRLSYTATPLTSAQAEQMVQILAANTPPRQPGSTPGAARGGPAQPGTPPPSGRGGPPTTFTRGIDVGGMVSVFGGGPGMPGGFDSGSRGTAPVTSAAVSQAQTVLAPTQVAALQQIQQQQQTQQQLRQMISDTMKASQPAGPADGAGKSAGGTGAPSGSSSSRRRGGG